MKKAFSTIVLSSILIAAWATNPVTTGTNGKESKPTNQSVENTKPDISDTYTWEFHGVTFTVPSGTKVLKNTENDFQVENDFFYIGIEVFNAEGISGEALGEAMVELAVEEGLVITDDSEIQEFSGTGFSGVSIEGTREDDSICGALLLSNKSQKVIHVTIVYGEGFQEEANKIINSFSMSK